MSCNCNVNCGNNCDGNMLICTMDILATKDCNNHCYYCIQGDHPKIYYPSNEIDTLTNFIDKFMEHNKGIIDRLNIMLFGGEPLMNKDLCHAMMDYCYDNFYNMTLITNGFLIPEYIDQLKKLSNRKLLNSLQISYDGQPNHDLYRCGTAKQVLDIINEVRIRGIEQLSIKSTLPLEGIKNLYDCYIDCTENLNLSYIPTFDYRYNSLNNTVDIDKYIETLKEQMMKIAKHSLENKVYPNTDLFDLNGNKVCGAGRYYFAIDHNLYASKCHQTAYNNEEEHIIGKINDDDINIKLDKCFEYHKAMEYVYSDECKNCEATLCKRCCEQNYQLSKKDNYLDRWYDKNTDNLCKLYKEVTKIAKAFNYLWNKQINKK